MESETVINSMGGSIKENMYKGAHGPPRKSLEQASLQLALFGLVAAFASAVMVPDPWVQLEPKSARMHQLN